MFRIAFYVLMLAVAWGAVHADTFPSRTITIVVPFPPGGPADVSTRIIGQALSEQLKQPVIIDNRPGASGQVGASVVKRAAADGYTLFLANSGSHAANQAIYPNLNYHPIADFAPIVHAVSIPQLLVVASGSRLTSVQDLIAAAKERPGEISYASQSIGAGGHVAAEILRSRNGLQFNHIPYQGSAPALQDVVGGRVDFIFDGMPSSLPFVQSGRLRALAIDAPARSALLPDVPTMVELGYVDYEASPWFGLVAPANTPTPAIEALNHAVNQVLADPGVARRLHDVGAAIAGGSAADFLALIQQDTQRFGEVISQSGAGAQ